MAQRPVFVPAPGASCPVRTELVDFTWFPGLSLAQKQKSVASLHQAARDYLSVDRVLEISTKSESPLGVALSAFNLDAAIGGGDRFVSVECVFQSSKVFEGGGPFLDILQKTSIEAKRDERLRDSGRLIEFRLGEDRWDLEPPSMFYDWVYLNALKASSELNLQLQSYQAFTDIEFNPERSINCQAYSIALFRSLTDAGQWDAAMASAESFRRFCREHALHSARQNDHEQPRLL